MDYATPSAGWSPWRFRRLRIAVSVFFAAVAVAFAVFWVRSHWYNDGFIVSGNYNVGVDTWRGRLVCTATKRPSTSAGITLSRWGSGAIGENGQMSLGGTAVVNALGFELRRPPNGITVAVPFWSLALLAAILGAAPWVKRLNRFSLRTLLIATTLIAVVLGLICYTVR